MQNIGILVGEDADLPKNLIKNLPINIFPFVVDKKEHKTSQPSVKTFAELFTKNLKKYQELLVITISSALSGTYNAALNAKKLLDNNDSKRVHVVDSKISTGGEGLIVLKIAKMINSGISISEVLSKLNKCISNTFLLGAFDDPKYLEKGGRINKVQSLVIKNMLKVGFRPILTIKDGRIVTKKIQREKDKAEALFSEFKGEIESHKLARHSGDPSADGDSRISKKNGFWTSQNDGKLSVAITHLDCEKDAIKLKKLVQDFSKNIKIEFVNEISPVVGAHLGPKSLIISWMIYK